MRVLHEGAKLGSPIHLILFQVRLGPSMVALRGQCFAAAEVRLAALRYATDMVGDMHEQCYVLGHT